MQSATLHIKVKPELANGLKALSKKRRTSVGELVRKAVLSAYQLELLNLDDRQKRALSAYQGGYISIGKLSEEMGRTVWDMRNWLEEHDIPQNNAFLDDDVKNA